MGGQPDEQVEAADAARVAQGVKALTEGRIDAARAIFLDVASRAPAVYQREFERDGTRFIKFWDLEEFTHYVTANGDRIKQKVVWLQSAYPRALYHLGFIAVKQGRPAAALEPLDAGYRLEPHPMFLAERGRALASLKRHDDAVAAYEEILRRGEAVGGRLRAVALRGIGFQLIELGRIDEAEEAFRASLTLDPDSPVAANELKYIAHLRHGGSIAPPQSVATGANGPTTCAACGSAVNGGKVFNASGRLLWLCPACAAAVARGPNPTQAPSVTVQFDAEHKPPQPARRKWWQFWL